MPDWQQLESGGYRVLADATYDWESWLTADGKLRRVNPAVYRFTGCSVPACLKMSDYPLRPVHPDDRREFEALLSTERTGSTDNDVKVRLRHHNGSIVYAAASWQPLQIPSMPPELRISQSRPGAVGQNPAEGRRRPSRGPTAGPQGGFYENFV